MQPMPFTQISQQLGQQMSTAAVNPQEISQAALYTSPQQSAVLEKIDVHVPAGLRKKIIEGKSKDMKRYFRSRPKKDCIKRSSG